MPSFLKLAGDDNVAVAARDVAPSSRARVGGTELEVRERIPLGHKVALRDIRAGENILKFGVPVGAATSDIPEGRHVHVHNVKSGYINNTLEYFE